jgi:hypothetical protein
MYICRGRSRWPQGLWRGSAAVLFAGIACSNPGGDVGFCVVSVVCRQIEFSASGWSLVMRSPADCGVYECDCVVSIMGSPWPTGGCCIMGRKNIAKGR